MLRGCAGAAAAWACVLSGCIPDVRELPPPAHPGSLTVTARADADAVSAGTVVRLAATVGGGRRPYLFRWDQNGILPAPVPLANATQSALTTPVLTTAGRYVFRVTVTDADGLVATDFVPVEVVEPFTLTLAVSDSDVFAGTAVVLTALVGAGAQSPTFAWEAIEQPEDAAIDLSAESAAQVTTPPLIRAGAYTFQVQVTDARGLMVSSQVLIDVRPAATIADPGLAFAGMPITLTASLDADAAGVSVLWSVIAGTGALTGEDTLTPVLVTERDESVIVHLTLSIPQPQGEPAVVTEQARVISVTSATPRVVIETNFGDFTIELDAERAPGHTKNFLRYVDEGFYAGLLLHRNACTENPQTGGCDPFVLQGGGYERIDGQLTLREPTHPTIASEAPNGRTNGELYSLSLALAGNNAASGRTQFFINLDDNAFLDDLGFTVFGRVVAGREVVDAIAAMPRTDNPTIPGEVSLPVEDVIMQQVRRE